MTCFETTDRNFGSRELRDSVEENIRFAREIDAAREKGDQPYLVEAHIGAHAPFTVPDEGLAMLREALKATGPRPAYPRGGRPLRCLSQPSPLR